MIRVELLSRQRQWSPWSKALLSALVVCGGLYGIHQLFPALAGSLFRTGSTSKSVVQQETTPKPETQQETTPSPVQEIASSPVVQQETTSEPVAQQEITPEPVAQQETTPNPEQEVASSPVVQQETMPSPIVQQETMPSPIVQQEITPSPIVQQEITPEPVAQRETAPRPVAQQDTSKPIAKQEATPKPEVVQREAIPSPGMQQETTPSPVQEIAHKPTAQQEVALGSAMQQETTPSSVAQQDSFSKPVARQETAPSSVVQQETAPAPTTSQAPSPQRSTVCHQIMRIDEQVPAGILVASLNCDSPGEYWLEGTSPSYKVLRQFRLRLQALPSRVSFSTWYEERALRFAFQGRFTERDAPPLAALSSDQAEQFFGKVAHWADASGLDSLSIHEPIHRPLSSAGTHQRQKLWGIGSPQQIGAFLQQLQQVEAVATLGEVLLVPVKSDERGWVQARLYAAVDIIVDEP